LQLQQIIPTCKPFDGITLSGQLKSAITELKNAEIIEPPTQGYKGTFEPYATLQPQEQDQSQEPVISTIPRNFSYVLGNENSAGKGKIYSLKQ